MRTLVLLVGVLSTSVVLGGQKTPPPAEQVYAEALERARAEEKLVFFEFGASWCAPCRRLEAFLSAPDTSAILAKHYVVCRITVWENKEKEGLNHPGGSELMYRLGGGSGVPYFGIADASGRVLESSRKAGVDYPAKRAQVETFMGLIDRTARGLSKADRRMLADFLVKHADVDGLIAGRVLSSAGAPVVNADVVLGRPTYRNGRWQFSTIRRLQSDEGGRYLFDALAPDDYVIRAEHASGTTAAEPTPVAAGDDVTRDLPLRQSYGALSASVLDPTGKPASAGVVSLANLRWPEMISTTKINDGAFQFPRLLPGEYVMSIQLPSADTAVGAQQEITIPAGELRTTTIRTHGGASLTGRIVLPPDAAQVAISNLHVLAIGASPPGGASSQMASAPVTSSHRFAFTGLFGRRFIRLRGLPEGWFLEAVRHQGTDTTDTTLDLSAGQPLNDVEIVLSDAGGQISGQVSHSDAVSRGFGAAIVFASDPRRHAFPSRFVRRAAVDDAGTFIVSGLPPGDYFVAAVQSLSSTWDAPESLTRLKEAATSVRVERRGRAHVTVRPAK